MSLLTKAEAALLARVSEKTIAREIAAGRIPATRIRGAVRIAHADLEEYLRQCRSVATVEVGKFAYSMPAGGFKSRWPVQSTRPS